MRALLVTCSKPYLRDTGFLVSCLMACCRAAPTVWPISIAILADRVTASSEAPDNSTSSICDEANANRLAKVSERIPLCG